jgi:hypothetical protein
MNEPIGMHETLMQFNSKLQDDLLVEVLRLKQQYVVRVLGETEKTFNSSTEAIKYAKDKNSTFYKNNQ